MLRRSGPQLGGTLVILSGSGFAVGQLTCVFGSADPVPASIASSTSSVCSSPPHSTTGWADLSLASYSTYLTGGASFFFTAPIFTTPTDPATGETLPPISPNTGPTYGGTVVTVAGTSFFDSPDAMCRFGERGYEVFARFTNVGTYECTSPSHPAAAVAVEISLNGQQFSNSLERVFEYQHPLVIHSISPHQGTAFWFAGREPMHAHACMRMGMHECIWACTSRMCVCSSVHVQCLAGPVTGGFPVYITGAYFQSSSAQSTLCRFRTTTSPASLISTTLIRCLTPSIAAAGFLPVEVTTRRSRRACT